MSPVVAIKGTRFKHLNNARFPLITIDDEVDMFSASYLLKRYNNGVAINTCKRDAKALVKLYNFIFSNDTDLFERLARLELPKIGEIESLAAHFSAHSQTGELVNSRTFKLYLGTAQNFIEHWFTFYQSRVTDPELLKACSISLTAMKNGFKISNDIPHNGQTKERIGLTTELMILFIAAINPSPENELNPWKSEKVRWRNYVLFLSLMLSGNRKGESLSLLTSDVQLVGKLKSFTITRRDRTFDGVDRSEISTTKTKGRTVALDDSMAEIFSHYITQIRPQFKGSNKSLYLFLSSKDGMPLHPNTPNQMTDELIKKFPVFAGRLTPHILRNTFHDLLSTGLDEELAGMGPMAKQQLKATLQEYIGGWATGSQMVAHYPKGSIQRRVGEMTQRIQQTILESGDKEDV